MFFLKIKGSERINFRDKQDNLQFFFDVDYAYSRADSANRQKVERVFYSKNGKNYLLVGVPYKWLMVAPEGEIVIDPTVHAATVQDTWIEDATNHGDRDRLLIGKSAGNPKKRTLIKFDLTGIPAGVELSDAKMRLQYYGRGGDPNAAWIDRPVAAHKILVDWNELEATTTRRMIDVAANDVNQIDLPWSAAYGQSGTDYSVTAENTQFITPDYPRWISWDITALTQAWLDGAAPNYGVMLIATNEAVDGYDLRFRSADYATANTMDLQFRPKLEIRWTLATRTIYFLKDHLGTTRAAITDAGKVVGYDDYDPWGLILANRSMTSQANMPYKFTGKEWDDDFGLNLYHFDWRSYDPVIGRWNGVDPLAGKDAHLTPYHYTSNNPVKYVDFDGRDFGLSLGIAYGAAFATSAFLAYQASQNSDALSDVTRDFFSNVFQESNEGKIVPPYVIEWPNGDKERTKPDGSLDKRFKNQRRLKRAKPETRQPDPLPSPPPEDPWWARLLDMFFGGGQGPPGAAAVVGSTVSNEDMANDENTENKDNNNNSSNRKKSGRIINARRERNADLSQQ